MRSCVLALVPCLAAVAGCSGPPGGGTSEPLPPLPPMSTAPSGPTRTVEEIRAEAEALAGQGDHPGAIELLEGALLVDAKDRDVLRLLAAYMREQSRAVRETDPAQSYRMMVSGGGYLRTLREAYPEPTDEERALAIDVLYDEAAAHARSVRLEEATGTLREAVGAGFRDLDRVRNDPDWEALRAVPQFGPIFDEIVAGAGPASPPA